MENHIEEIMDYFEEDIFDDRFENYRKSIITTVAYLIGVPDDKLAIDDLIDPGEYEKIKTNEKAKIIRCLSILRTQFLRNYKSIDNATKFEMRPLETLTEYLDVDAIKFLRRKEIEINITNAKSPTVNIAYINQYLLDNIDSIKPLIPDWVKFPYIKGLFLMPGGYAGRNGANIRND